MEIGSARPILMAFGMALMIPLANAENVPNIQIASMPSVAFLSDDQFAICTSGTEISILDFSTRKVLATIKLEDRHRTIVGSIHGLLLVKEKQKIGEAIAVYELNKDRLVLKSSISLDKSFSNVSVSDPYVLVRTLAGAVILYKYEKNEKRLEKVSVSLGQSDKIGQVCTSCEVSSAGDSSYFFHQSSKSNKDFMLTVLNPNQALPKVKIADLNGILTCHINAVALTDDPNEILFSDIRGNLTRYSFKLRTSVQSFPCPKNLDSILFDARHKLITAIGEDCSVNFYAANDGKLIDKMALWGDCCCRVFTSPNKTRLVIATAGSGTEYRISFVNLDPILTKSKVK